MRSQDTLILSELHPQEIENLRANMKRPCENKNLPSIKIHNRNGWEMLTALTPPVTKRGAVLIDPSYEETSDYNSSNSSDSRHIEFM
jgi:23S rRNA (adenine2030-N6)-methyltransferase